MIFIKKNLNGSGYVITCVIVLIVAMFLLFLFAILSAWSFTSDVQKKVSSAVIQVSQDNYTNIYSSSREGYTGAYKLNKNNSWDVNINPGDIYNELETSLGATKQGKEIIKSRGNDMYYKIYDIETKATCSRFQSAKVSTEKFQATTTFKLCIYFTWYDQRIPFTINLKSTSNYSSKFFANDL